MQTINLYKYIDEDGTVITPNRREESDQPYCYRLIADEGYILTDGEIQTPCVDTHEPEEWYEIEDDNIENNMEEIN